jgi:hypothetical protein
MCMHLATLRVSGRGSLLIVLTCAKLACSHHRPYGWRSQMLQALTIMQIIVPSPESARNWNYLGVPRTQRVKAQKPRGKGDNSTPVVAH